MRKFILSLALIVACVLSASAKSFVLTLKDGTKVYFAVTIDKSAVMDISKGNITIEDKNTYTFEQVKSFVLSNENDPNAINDVEMDGGASYKANTLVVPGNLNTVKVYDASGAQVEANISESNGRVIVNLNNMNKGVYVVSTGSTSFKVIKK